MGYQQNPLSIDKFLHMFVAITIMSVLGKMLPAIAAIALILVTPPVFEALECMWFHRTYNPLSKKTLEMWDKWFRTVDTKWDIVYTASGGFIGLVLSNFVNVYIVSILIFITALLFKQSLDEGR